MPASAGRKSVWPVIGAVALIGFLGGCSVTETVNNILSSTTPSDWYNSDGLPKAEHKVDIFVAINLDNLKADMAKGQGEYLESLSTLLEVPHDRRSEFSRLVQEKYTVFGVADRNTVAKALIGLSNSLGSTMP